MVNNIEDITIAILAKDKSECLDLYLECILNFCALKIFILFF